MPEMRLSRAGSGNRAVKVSVAMIVYNHEKFVTQAIESVLTQEVDFDYEIVIGEDVSTDRTREIVVDFGKRYPQTIRLVLPESNLGMQENFRATLEACSGKYVALLEGDDYWTSPLKLKKQVEFLETHSECALCFHNVVRTSCYDGEADCIFPESKYRRDCCTIEDLLVENFIPTCSVVFRRGLFGKLPEWIAPLGFSDWPLHILNSQVGSIGYINETLGVYRVHPGGAWSGLISTRRRSNIVRFYEVIDAHLKFKYHRIIKRQASEHLFELLSKNLRDIPNRRLHYLRNVLMHPYISIVHQLNLFGIVFFPRVRSSAARVVKLCLQAVVGQRGVKEKDKGIIASTNVTRGVTEIAET